MQSITYFRFLINNLCYFNFDGYKIQKKIKIKREKDERKKQKHFRISCIFALFIKIENLYILMTSKEKDGNLKFFPLLLSFISLYHCIIIRKLYRHVSLRCSFDFIQINAIVSIWIGRMQRSITRRSKHNNLDRMIVIRPPRRFILNASSERTAIALMRLD